MKKLWVLVGILIITTSAYAVDTEIPNVNLSEGQLKNLVNFVAPTPFKGFGFHGSGKVVGVSEVSPTAQEIENARQSILAIPSDPSKEYYASIFEWRDLFNAMKQSFSIAVLREFSPQLIVIREYIIIQDFSGLRDYMDNLVVAGVINQTKWNAFNNLLKQQNVDLLDW